MSYYMIDYSQNRITEFDNDKQTVDLALKIMKDMRWVKVKRRGRRGNRHFIVTIRNRDEWKMGYAKVDGRLVRLA